MRRLTLLISGNVQKAGYRDLVVRFGTALSLRGYAENLPDGSVKVVAEGAEQKFELLKISVNIRDALINVEKIEGSFSKATGEFSNFYKLVKEGETDERLDKAAELLKELIGAVQSGFKETVTSINSVKANTSEMLEKQDLHIEITRAGFADLKEEVHMQRDDFKEVFMKEVSELHSEINDIRATLFRIQQAQEI